MADDDGSRRPSQPSTPMNPAGVGSSASNRGSPMMVSPGTLREILQTGDLSLISDTFEQWGDEDATRLLEALPSPIRASPVGVGSAASNRSSTPSPSPGVPRTPTGAVAGTGGGGGGGGGGSSPGSSSGSRSGASSGSCGRGSTPRGTGRASTPQGSGRGGHPNLSPTLPWSRPGSSTQVSPRAPLNQADLQRRLRMLLQDQEQISVGRRIANITTTNSIVTSYKEGGRPSVQSNSSRYSF